MLRVGATVERQEWGQCRRFPGQVVVDSRKEALDTAVAWNRRDTIWTDGSRLDDCRVGAACVWRTQSPEGWEGRCFHLGDNKEVFNAEFTPSYRLLRLLTRGRRRATST